MRFSLPLGSITPSIQVVNSKSVTPLDVQGVAPLKFGVLEDMKQGLTDLQFSTARGSNEEIARPKRVTSFTETKHKKNESVLNTERLRGQKTIRSNPGENKRSNDSGSNNI